MPWGVDTHTHTHIPTHEQKQFQETRSIRPSSARTWFKSVTNYFVQSYIIHLKDKNIASLNSQIGQKIPNGQLLLCRQ